MCKIFHLRNATNIPPLKYAVWSGISVQKSMESFIKHPRVDFWQKIPNLESSSGANIPFW